MKALAPAAPVLAAGGLLLLLFGLFAVPVLWTAEEALANPSLRAAQWACAAIGLLDLILAALAWRHRR